MILTSDRAESCARSFRDPAGSVIRRDGRVLRIVDERFVGSMEAFLATRAARAALKAGTLIASERLSRIDSARAGLDGEAHVFEHERVWFPSYPYEWPAEMLHAAGMLTIDLALAALEEGFGLKDATPYNVLFRGAQPVFVDVLSFERRNALHPVWMAYAQFARTFLLPLLAARSLGLPVSQTLAASREGLEPEVVYRWAGIAKRLSPGFLTLVTLPHLMGQDRRSGEATYQAKPASSEEQARFILDGILRSCRRRLKALEPDSEASSTWTGYLEHKSLYNARQLAQKVAFVHSALELATPAQVLDIGANEGHFSLLAARRGASVVAIDVDPAVVGSIWRKAAAEELDVLPLVVDIARPTPATGWKNEEAESFLDRARGKFDFAMMLAVLHHLLVTERIPLDQILSLAAELTREYLVIEFVEPGDPMFQRIVRGRGELYAHLTREFFETAARQQFELVRSGQVEGLHRWLYLLRRRHASN
jgi:SAM-dependent methyltransferase